MKGINNGAASGASYVPPDTKQKDVKETSTPRQQLLALLDEPSSSLATSSSSLSSRLTGIGVVRTSFAEKVKLNVGLKTYSEWQTVTKDSVEKNPGVDYFPVLRTQLNTLLATKGSDRWDATQLGEVVKLVGEAPAGLAGRLLAHLASCVGDAGGMSEEQLEEQFGVFSQALVKAAEARTIDPKGLEDFARAVGSRSGIRGDKLIKQLATLKTDPGHGILQAATVGWLTRPDALPDIRYGLEFLADEIPWNVPSAVVGRMAAAYLDEAFGDSPNTAVETALVGLMTTTTAPQGRIALVSAALFDRLALPEAPANSWDHGLARFNAAARKGNGAMGMYVGGLARGLIISTQRRASDDVERVTAALRQLASSLAPQSSSEYLAALTAPLDKADKKS